MRDRMVGANELNAIAALDAIAGAQREYVLADHDADGALEYAMRVMSTPGQQDGLYWERDANDPDTSPAPLELLKMLADAVLGERATVHRSLATTSACSVRRARALRQGLSTTRSTVTWSRVSR